VKVKSLVAIFALGIMIVAGASPISAHSQSNEKLQKFYETCIAKKIAKCQSKTMLQTSKSENLQLTAEKAASQARFLSLNKEMLVNEMMEKDIGRKPYKIEHYLNSRFHEVFK
jgi:hypothetical protein